MRAAFPVLGMTIQWRAYRFNSNLSLYICTLIYLYVCSMFIVYHMDLAKILRASLEICMI
jgi:hypothetical protein